LNVPGRQRAATTSPAFARLRVLSVIVPLLVLAVASAI